MLRNLFLAAVAAMLLAVPTSAQAYWPYGGYGGNFAGGPAFGYNYIYGVGYNSAPPYYSIFPPVYYSPQITARPYGASPYAWPAGYSPGAYAPRYEAAPPAAPQMIVNPYVAGR